MLFAVYGFTKHNSYYDYINNSDNKSERFAIVKSHKTSARFNPYF